MHVADLLFGFVPRGSSAGESEGTMLTGSSATTHVRQREQSKTIRRKQRAGILDHLRLIARQHQVCYEIWPHWSTSHGVRKQKGFELLLCGVNGHVLQEGGMLHAVTCCEHCAHTYSELREIAEWVLHLKKQPSSYKIYSFDCALHLAPPHRKHRHEIVIATVIFHHSEHLPADYPRDSECLKEVRARLSKLGVREDTLVTQPAGNA